MFKVKLLSAPLKSLNLGKRSHSTVKKQAKYIEKQNSPIALRIKIVQKKGLDLEAKYDEMT